MHEYTGAQKGILARAALVNHIMVLVKLKHTVLRSTVLASGSQYRITVKYRYRYPPLREGLLLVLVGSLGQLRHRTRQKSTGNNTTVKKSKPSEHLPCSYNKTSRIRPRGNLLSKSETFSRNYSTLPLAPSYHS